MAEYPASLIWERTLPSVQTPKVIEGPESNSLVFQQASEIVKIFPLVHDGHVVRSRSASFREYKYFPGKLILWLEEISKPANTTIELRACVKDSPDLLVGRLSEDALTIDERQASPTEHHRFANLVYAIGHCLAKQSITPVHESAHDQVHSSEPPHARQYDARAPQPLPEFG